MVKCAVTFLLVASTLLASASDWPQWLGPNRNGHSTENCPSSLPADFKPAWKIAIGGGFSSPVINGERLVYFDEDGTNEVLHAVHASSGKELWRAVIGPRYEDEWGAGPRSTPFIDGDRVYAQSCTGEFHCRTLVDGKAVWKVSFEKDFGVKFLGSKAGEGTAARRGNNGCGMVDGDHVIVPVGSTNGATLVCFDKHNGTVRWKTGNDEAAYSSVQVATLAGVKQVIYLSAEALNGIGRATGKLLWRVPLKTGAKRHAASPVIFGDNVIVNSHTFGTICFKVSRAGDRFSANELWRNKEMKINLATPVLVGQHLFSQGPRKDFVCLDAQTGVLRWSAPGFGKDYAATMVLGQNLLVLADTGELMMISAAPGKYTELNRIQVCGKTWSFPALSDGNLYVRDGRELARYSLVR